jgi:signal transduction histidine kinase
MTKMPPETPPDTNDVAHFSAHVAHDLNNLLTGILGNLELMQNRARRTGITNFDSYLDGARNAGARAADFARRLLAFSGQASHERAAISVASVLHGAADTMPVTNLSVHNEAGRADVFCDGAQLTLSLIELLKNAAEATASGGTITLTASLAAENVIITVQDSGAGMESGILSRCTMPFFSTQPNGTGKGLGLPIASRFAQSAGGALEITSVTGAGTTAKLILPCFSAPP